MAQLQVTYILECEDEDVDDVIDQLTDWYASDSSFQTQEGIDYRILPESVTVGSAPE